MRIAVTLAKDIRQRVDALGRNTAWLAGMTGLSPRQLQQVLQGEQEVTWAWLAECLHVLGMEGPGNRVIVPPELHNVIRAKLKLLDKTQDWLAETINVKRSTLTHAILPKTPGHPPVMIPLEAWRKMIDVLGMEAEAGEQRASPPDIQEALAVLERAMQALGDKREEFYHTLAAQLEQRHIAHEAEQLRKLRTDQRSAELGA